MAAFSQKIHSKKGVRPPRCVSTGPVVVRLAELANLREREREPSKKGTFLRSEVSNHAIRC
jgi:hypothetical protein